MSSKSPILSVPVEGGSGRAVLPGCTGRSASGAIKCCTGLDRPHPFIYNYAFLVVFLIFFSPLSDLKVNQVLFVL